MKTSAVACVRHVIDEYRRFLHRSYRFLEEHIRQQLENNLAQAGVVVTGPSVTFSPDFARDVTLRGRAYNEKERDVMQVADFLFHCLVCSPL